MRRVYRHLVAFLHSSDNDSQSTLLVLVVRESCVSTIHTLARHLTDRRPVYADDATSSVNTVDDPATIGNEIDYRRPHDLELSSDDGASNERPPEWRYGAPHDPEAHDRCDDRDRPSQPCAAQGSAAVPLSHLVTPRCQVATREAVVSPLQTSWIPHIRVECQLTFRASEPALPSLDGKLRPPYPRRHCHPQRLWPVASRAAYGGPSRRPRVS